jgi:alpha,alpha-trehalose phosphorylase
MLRPRYIPPKDTFPPNPWAFEAVRYDARLARELTGQAETMFALSNGYLGIRGAVEEGTPAREAGTYINGFYEHRPISYGEHAYGFPTVGQSILNCPNGTVLKLFVDDEPFVVPRAEILDYRRSLDLRTGTLNRDVRWVTATGKRLHMRTVRLVSLAHRHLAAIEFELTAEDMDVEVAVSSELENAQALSTDTTDPRLAEGFVGRVLHPTGTRSAGLRAMLSYRTGSSGLSLGCGMDHSVASECSVLTELACNDDAAAVLFRCTLARNKPLRICKYLSYHYSDIPDPAQILFQTASTLDYATRHGFEAILERQKSDVDRFWARADVTVESDNSRTQQVIRWNLFQLLQASERAEGHGIGARGLTGRTYEGHYFWDTEIYVLPFLIYTNPAIARSVLKFRYDMLDKARARARELGHRGATFPWRTINGEEASAYYAAGTAQYHINADIAYAMRKYVDVTGDEEFLWSYGAEILIETARLWFDLGFFSDVKGGRFCINGVTGPDEYTALVNNNCFTNLMARENLRYAVQTVRALERLRPDQFAALVARTGLDQAELGDWEEASERMYVPYDERLKVHPQDDDFLNLEKWNFASTPEDRYPLLLHYHPLNLYRSQVIKQADIVMAMFLLSDNFTRDEKKANFDYYDPLTTHDSSLSVCVQSIIANEIGLHQRATEYFEFAAAMDMADIGGNMMHGAHVAAIGGTWLALAYGFAGLRDREGCISFNPILPKAWSALKLVLTVRGQRVRVEIDRTSATYRLMSGERLNFSHAGEDCILSSAEPVLTRPVAAVQSDPQGFSERH